MTNEENLRNRVDREIDLAAKQYVDVVRNGRSRFNSENGRRGGSPWAELINAVEARQKVYETRPCKICAVRIPLDKHIAVCGRCLCS